jgi:single-strand DNA-binding protein
MSGSFNRVVLVGNAGKDAELKMLPSGQPVCNFSVATSERWTDKSSGEKKESTQWHTIQCFGKLAEICEKYVKKGKQVLVEGKIIYRPWEKDGVKHTSTEIRADSVTLLGKMGEDGGQGDKPAAAPAGDYDDLGSTPF